MRETDDAAAVAAGFAKCLSQNPTDIFHGMVTVNFQIAFRVDLQIKMPVPRQLSQHVIKERNAGSDLIFPGAI